MHAHTTTTGTVSVKTAMQALVLFALFFFLFTPFVASAQEDYVPLSPLPGITEGLTAESYLETIFEIAVGIAALLAVIMVAFGGFQYVTSAAFSTKEEGKRRIWTALGGLLLIFAAWIILNTINPELLRLDFGFLQEEVEEAPTAEEIEGEQVNEGYYICYTTDVPEVKIHSSGTSAGVCDLERDTLFENPGVTGVSRCFQTPNIKNPTISMCPIIESALEPTERPDCKVGVIDRGCFPEENKYWYCTEPGEGNAIGPYSTLASCNTALGGLHTVPPDGKFTYDKSASGGDISLQIAHASAPLSTLLTCMANTVPGDVGRISSISDNVIVSGEKTMNECRAGGQSIGCAHTRVSCHYGGTAVPGCQGKSFAVDFGDEENKDALIAAARSCGTVKIKDEGDHIHISVGAAEGCGCDLNL